MEAFFPALFETGDTRLAMDRAVGEVFGGQPLDIGSDISSVLRGLLARRGISIVPEGEFQQRAPGVPQGVWGTGRGRVGLHMASKGLLIRPRGWWWW